MTEPGVDGEPVFAVLGPLEARVGGHGADLGPAKQRALLGVLLALAPNAVTVERLVDELWPEGGPGQPLRSLQVYVSALRRALAGEGHRLVTAGRAYRVDVAGDAVDAAVFDRLSRLATERLRGGAPTEALAAADAALALWRGEAWQGLREVPVLGVDATRLEEQRLDVRTTRAAALLALGRHRDLVTELEALVRRHPLHEGLRGHLMLALHRSGRQAEALQVFAAGRSALAAETGLDPGAALRELQAAILRDDPALRVEDADLRARRHLPAPATPLVGRRHEAAEVLSALDGGTRLLTLAGPGGVGKTRLALATAHEAAARYPDGVWFVDLAGVDDAAGVGPAVAEALDLDPGAPDPAAVLLDHVAGRRLLLVLDNLEQVTDAAELVSLLLSAGEGLQVLATSRVPLRTYGERVHRLEPLEPDDAVALFTERATAADRRFDGGGPGAVAQVCAALDRLPLAIELAAAKVGELTLDELVDALDRPLELASDGPRERPGRQRELRATIAWSIELLPAAQARAFTRLGVFAGGFDVDGAAAVGVDRAALTGLLRASLLVRDGERFRMLETIREHALERLADDPERGVVRDRHAAHHLALAEQVRPGMSGAASTALVRRLRAERANLQAAQEHLEGGGRWLELLRMTTALTVFWYRTAVREEDLSRLERALARATGADDHLRGRAHYGLAICRAEQGRSARAMAACRESHRLMRQADDAPWLARVSNSLAGLARDAGHAAEAAALLDEVIDLRRRLDDPDLSVRIPLHNRALVAMDLGDAGTARRCLDEERALAAGDEMEEAWIDSTFADLALAEGDVGRAKDLLRRAVPVLREHGAESRLVELLDTFAAVAALEGRSQDAAVLVAAADAAIEATGSELVPADALLRERRVGATLAGLDEATRRSATAHGGALSIDAALELGTDLLG